MIADDLSRVAFTLENRTGGRHETGLTVAGLPNGSYAVAVSGRVVTTLRGSPVAERLRLPIGGEPTTEVTITRSAR